MNLLTTALIGLFLLGGSTSNVPNASPLPTFTVAMTGYNAVPGQTDSDPMTTASGARSNPDVVAARSIDLADELPFGTVIAISPKAATSTKCGIGIVEDQIGYRVVADSMHPRKRNQIDLMFDMDNAVKVGGKQVNPAVAMGVCSEVEIAIVGKIEISKMPRSQSELKKVVESQLLAIKK